MFTPIAPDYGFNRYVSTGNIRVIREFQVRNGNRGRFAIVHADDYIWVLDCHDGYVTISRNGKKYAIKMFEALAYLECPLEISFLTLAKLMNEATIRFTGQQVDIREEFANSWGCLLANRGLCAAQQHVLSSIAVMHRNCDARDADDTLECKIAAIEAAIEQAPTFVPHDVEDIAEPVDADEIATLYDVLEPVVEPKVLGQVGFPAGTFTTPVFVSPVNPNRFEKLIQADLRRWGTKADQKRHLSR